MCSIVDLANCHNNRSELGIVNCQLYQKSTSTFSHPDNLWINIMTASKVYSSHSCNVSTLTDIGCWRSQSLFFLMVKGIHISPTPTTSKPSIQCFNDESSREASLLHIKSFRASRRQHQSLALLHKILNEDIKPSTFYPWSLDDRQCYRRHNSINM